jgi:hypothetical protein
LYLQSRDNVVAAIKGTKGYDDIIKILEDKEEGEQEQVDNDNEAK